MKSEDMTVKRSEFLPFSAPTIGPEEINEVADSMTSGWLTTGPKVRRFVEKFTGYAGAKYGVALNSATAGLHISYLAAGLKPGDEVLTSPMTFAATANTVLHAGGRVAFADIDVETRNVGVKALKEKITPETKIIVPVHFAGLPCDMDPILKLAKENNALVIEDAAHAIGAEYKGRRIGSIGDMTVFSFHPNKNITTGEGGMITFDNGRFREKLELLSFHGQNKNSWKKYPGRGPADYDIELAGFKYNMLDIQAAIGLHQLDRVEEFNAKRSKIAGDYYEGFADVGELLLPKPPEFKHKHVWHLFTPLVKTEKLKITRDQFMAELKIQNIGTGYHYRAVHLHPLYRSLGFKRGEFPNAEYVSDRVVSLPLFPKMTQNDTRDVIRAVKKVISRNLNK